MQDSENPEQEKPVELSATRPIFYDEERRRWPLFVRFLVVLFSIVGAGLLLLVISLIALPLMPRTKLPKPAVAVEQGNPDPILSDRQHRALGFKQVREESLLEELQKQLRDRRAEKIRKEEEFLRLADDRANKRAEAHTLTPGKEPTPSIVPKNARPVVAAFYVNWDETSRASAHRNIAHVSHLIPEWLHLKASDYTDYTDTKTLTFLDRRTSIDRLDITPLARSHNVPILPIINNLTSPKGAEEGVGSWDTRAIHNLTSVPAARQNFIRQLRDWLLGEHLQGINIDFEEVDEADRDNLSLFMKELYADFSSHGLLVTQDVQMDNSAFDTAELAKWNDWVIPMCYDQHSEDTEPGPVAGVDWTDRELNKLLAVVPAQKVVVGVGNHGYDWPEDVKGAATVTYESAIIAAKESDPEARIHLDAASLNPYFTYRDDKDVKHTVWMQDAVSVYNQLASVRSKGIRGSALWYMGSEDPSLWNFYSKDLWNSDWNQIVMQGHLNTISYNGQDQIDFEGEGELLLPLSPPADGKRITILQPKSGLITRADYQVDPLTGRILYPSSHVVRRYGGKGGNPDKKIVLTFDDGPDPQWTPQVLDILKQYHIKATFFIVGKQAEAYPDLVRRIWNEGHEIGNHSLTHPDLFKLSVQHQQLELTMTQRIIQSLTGHSTILFRPPYGNDVEPETGREVSPLEIAAGLGYLTVGQKNDPQDWRLDEYFPGTEAQDPSRPRTPEEIVKSVIVNRNEGSILLLHDGGGERYNTIQALPEIIKQLHGLGYTFQSVAEFRGVPKDVLMPPVTGRDLLLAGGDRYVFEVTYLFQRTLTTLFTLSLILGFSRVGLFVCLALVQRFRETRRIFPVGFTPTVSVVIAAFNEEKVIARTVHALLDGDYKNLEIIVVDDGSADHTSEVVQTEFKDDPRVRLITKQNGGKSTALNRGLQVAKGDVIVSLDADTLFTRDTITRLARHFADPKVGAVSGNVRVGNVHNLLTRWQALEYITSQNFDRRGYDLLNCITVVPGAVGALRRAALSAVGGYTGDTLAEDTDLTWKLRRAGWRIVNDNSAMAYTEAPETLRSLAKQRFRWAFGTLQCLWKHRGAVGHHGAFGCLALPSLWLYQILFPAVSPFMDIAVVWSLFAGNFSHVAFYYLMMFAIELLAATIAIIMDGASLGLLPWLFFQRFLYRQLMYYVILKSLLMAIRGGTVGWNKLERTGSAQIEKRSA